MPRAVTDDLPGAELADARVIAAARRGSAHALGHVLEQCRRYLLTVASSELDTAIQPKLAVSDVVQETFLEAQRIFERFLGGSQDELRAWLRAILLNKIADGERQYAAAKRKVDKEVSLTPCDTAQIGIDLPAPAGTPSVALMAQERAAALTAAITRLPAAYRQVIVWRQLENLSFEQMAGRLGQTVEAVRKRWWRAVQHLQSELGERP
jgi:RNA polymerase sigma-70 factor (ECF subfamily)